MDAHTFESYNDLNFYIETLVFSANDVSTHDAAIVREHPINRPLIPIVNEGSAQISHFDEQTTLVLSTNNSTTYFAAIAQEPPINRPLTPIVNEFTAQISRFDEGMTLVLSTNDTNTHDAATTRDPPVNSTFVEAPDVIESSTQV